MRKANQARGVRYKMAHRDNCPLAGLSLDLSGSFERFSKCCPWGDTMSSLEDKYGQVDFLEVLPKKRGVTLSMVFCYLYASAASDPAASKDVGLTLLHCEGRSFSPA